MRASQPARLCFETRTARSDTKAASPNSKEPTEKAAEWNPQKRQPQLETDWPVSFQLQVVGLFKRNSRRLVCVRRIASGVCTPATYQRRIEASGTGGGLNCFLSFLLFGALPFVWVSVEPVLFRCIPTGSRRLSLRSLRPGPAPKKSGECSGLRTRHIVVRVTVWPLLFRRIATAWFRLRIGNGVLRTGARLRVGTKVLHTLKLPGLKGVKREFV